MTLDENRACHICFISGKPGDIFVKNLLHLQLSKIKCSKKIYNSNVKIDNIGVRHGEKKHENLLSSEDINFIARSWRI